MMKETAVNNTKRYDAYKDSGISWLEEIPQHWELKRFKHIFKEKKITHNVNLNCGSISFGKVVYKDDEKIPVSTKKSYQVLNKGEFLINPLNLNYDLKSLRIGLSDKDVVVSSGYIIVQNTTEISKDYYKWLLHIFDVTFMKTLGSGVRQTLSFTHIANSELVFPPLQEQTKIAQFLDDKTTKIDEAIAIKEQQIQLLKERKQIGIHKAVTQGLNPNVKLKNSGVEWIGEIPEGWEVKKMTYVCKIDTGATPDRSNGSYWDGDIPWIKTGEVNYGIINTSEEFITVKGLKNSATRLAPVGTLLMAMYGQGVTRGRVSLLGIEATYNQACCAMLFNKEIYNKYAFYFFVMSYSYIRDGGNETSQMNISAGYISGLKILQPPLSEQKEISAYIETASQKIETAISLKQQEIEKLKEYKSSLINGVVTGKVKVC